MVKTHIFGLLSLSLLWGCHSEHTTQKTVKTTTAVKSSTPAKKKMEHVKGPKLILVHENISIFSHDERIYVTGKKSSSSAFKKHGHLPYTKTLLGAGPNGETLVFEVDRKNPSYVEDLMDNYQDLSIPLHSNDEDLFVYKKGNRIYVVGSKKVNKSFKMHGHLPYTKTLIGEGQNGETLVFEVNKKDPEFVEDLMDRYSEIPVLIKKVGTSFFAFKKGKRIYVVGSKKSYHKFKSHGHLPYTKTLIGQGPKGETLVFEINKKDPSLVNRLEKTYNEYM